MSEIILQIKDISKSFGRIKVLNDVNLSINKGDRYILFGSNGAGKTTLVKILSSILKPDSGEIKYYGETINKNIKTKIGFMSHDTYLYNDLSAIENLKFYARLYSIKNPERKIKDLLNEIGLYHRAYDKTNTFSRGMKQRLSLARSILHDPDIIFLDEAYAGLDIKATEMLNDIVIRLNQSGKTFFFITHDTNKIFDIGTRIGILSKGKILYESIRGDKQVFTEKYKNIIDEEIN